MSDLNKLTIGGVTYMARNIEMTEPKLTPQQIKINYIVAAIKKILNNSTHTLNGWISTCKGYDFNIEYTTNDLMAYRMTMQSKEPNEVTFVHESYVVFQTGDLYKMAIYLYNNRSEFAYLTDDEQNA